MYKSKRLKGKKKMSKKLKKYVKAKKRLLVELIKLSSELILSKAKRS